MIHEKPFVFSEMLRRTIFLGRPNFFNAKCLNKEFETIHSFMEEFNKAFAVTSKIKFTFSTLGETLDITTSPNKVTRSLHVNWTGEPILYKGVKFSVVAGGITHNQIYNAPNTTISPRGVKPSNYIVLKATLSKLNFASNPTLCGITSDESPTAVPSVEVEQYNNITIGVSNDLSEPNIICILGTLHPKYKTNGDANGFGFISNTFNNDSITIDNGLGNAKSTLSSNGSMFDYITERITNKIRNILNERQLVRRFNLADIQDFGKGRHNIGFSEIVNKRQLVGEENLRDIPSKPMARQNLGLGNSAIRNIGTGAGDVAQGDIIKIGVVIMWYGAVNAIPSGWVECNGADGTPDMRGNFPVGYKAGDNDYLLGQTGGAKSVTLKGAESGLQSHTHAITDPGHTHGVTIKGGTDKHSDGNHSNKRSDRDEAYTSDISKTGITVDSISAKDAIDAHENRPPYVALMFIMYKGVTIAVPTLLVVEALIDYPNFSAPNTAMDGGYSEYDFDAIANADYKDLGAGVTLTNPE